MVNAEIKQPKPVIEKSQETNKKTAENFPKGSGLKGTVNFRKQM